MWHLVQVFKAAGETRHLLMHCMVIDHGASTNVLAAGVPAAASKLMKSPTSSMDIQSGIRLFLMIDLLEMSLLRRTRRFRADADDRHARCES